MPNNYYALMDAIANSGWTPDEQAQARRMVAAKGIGPPMPPPPLAAELRPDQPNTTAPAASPTTYRQVADKIAEGVKAGYLTRPQQLQLHQTLAQKGYGPGIPAPPIPAGLQPDQPNQPNTFLTSPHGFIREGLRRAVHGVEGMAQSGLDAKLGGAAEVAAGLGTAAIPAALPFALANPVGAAYGLAGGYTGAKAARYGAGLLGAPEGATNLAEQVGGLLGGGVTARYGPALTSAVGRALGNGAAEVLGKTTGAGGEGVRTAFGPHSQEFTDAMRGKVSEDGLVSKLKDATATLADNRSRAYQADLASIRGIDQPLPAARAVLADTLQEQAARFNVRLDPDGTLDFSRSTINSPEAQSQVRGVIGDLQSWGQQPGDHTPLGLDTLKRRIGDFYSDSSQARSFVQGIKTPITNLLRNVPGYAEMSDHYAASSQLLSNVNSELSAANPNPGTIIRKLQAVTGQANNYRPALLDKLDAATNSNVSDAAMGWGFRDLMPRGQVGRYAPFAAGATAFTHPTALPLGLLASPRFVGEGASLLGPAIRAVPPNSFPWLYGSMGGLLGTNAIPQMDETQ